MNFFLTFETCNCGKGMLGFLFFFFFFINVGKCDPIALMINDLCNEFWGISSCLLVQMQRILWM